MNYLNSVKSIVIDRLVHFTTLTLHFSPSSSQAVNQLRQQILYAERSLVILARLLKRKKFSQKMFDKQEKKNFDGTKNVRR